MTRRFMSPIVLALAVALVAALEVVGAPVAVAATINVGPGQSIQAAIDSASPGDTIVVAPGTYRENIQINKDDITLQGAGSTDGNQTSLAPPGAATAAHNACYVSGSNFDGICITASDPSSGVITTPLSGDTVSGFLVRGFPGIGIHAFGAFNVTIDHNRLTNNATDGVAVYAGGGVAISDNQAVGSSEAGILEADAPRPAPVPVPNRAFIANNVTTDNGVGIEVRDNNDASTFFNPSDPLSNKDVIENDAEGNCVGILALDTPSPGGTRAFIAGNRVIANNKTYPSLTGVPATVSGTGILVLGAEYTSVRNNTIRDNVPSDIRLPYAGGLVVANYPGGPQISGFDASVNTAYGDQPFDIRVLLPHTGQINKELNGPGSGIIFVYNNCDTSKPKMIVLNEVGTQPGEIGPLCRPTAASQSPGFPGYGPGF